MSDILDIKDKRLIYYLSQNARESHTQLAKKIGLSKNSIKYRIERLQKEKIIKKFSAIIDLGAFNCETIIVLCRFNKDIYTTPETLDYFKNHNYCDWAASLSGEWDIISEFAIKDLNHIRDLIKEITSKFKETLNTYKMICSGIIIKVEHLPEEFYKDLDTPILTNKTHANGNYILAEEDKKILSAISENSSLNYVELTKKAGLTADIIHYRLPKLVEKGIIIKFIPEINLQKLGYTEYFCLIKLKNTTPKIINEITQKIRTNPHITYAFQDSFSPSVGFVVALKKAEDLDSLLRTLRSNYTNNIEEMSYMIIKEQLLFNLFPKGLIQKP